MRPTKPFAQAPAQRPGPALWGRRGRYLPLLASLALGLLVLVTACGSGAPKVATVGTTTTEVRGSTSGGPAAAGGDLVEYARCMRSHGIPNFPEPGSLGSPGSIRQFKGQVAQAVGSLASTSAFPAAQRACARYYGQATPPPAKVSPERLRELLAVARCMRAHGVPQFPDPNPTTGAMGPPASV